MVKKDTIPIEHKVMTVIDNFQCNIPEIELSKYLSIRRIDTLSELEQKLFSGDMFESTNHSIESVRGEEVQQAFTVIRYPSIGELYDRTLERGNHVFYWHFKEFVKEPIKEHYDFLLTPYSKIDHALSALRILKDKRIGLFPSESVLIEFPPFDHLPNEFKRSTHQSHNGYILSKPNEVEPYLLDGEEIDVLKKLYTAIKGCKQPGLLTSQSRLQRQYIRAHISDRLIDAVIALEALYSGDVRMELAFRIGLRCSTLLSGDNANLREDHFDLFKLAYDLRSRLVHGSIYNSVEIKKLVQKKGWVNEEEFMLALDNMLRQSLREILLNVGNRKLKLALHQPLDKAISRGENFSWSL